MENHTPILVKLQIYFKHNSFSKKINRMINYYGYMVNESLLLNWLTIYHQILYLYIILPSWTDYVSILICPISLSMPHSILKLSIIKFTTHHRLSRATSIVIFPIAVIEVSIFPSVDTFTMLFAFPKISLILITLGSIITVIVNHAAFPLIFAICKISLIF